MQKGFSLFGWCCRQQLHRVCIIDMEDSTLDDVWWEIIFFGVDLCTKYFPVSNEGYNAIISNDCWFVKQQTILEQQRYQQNTRKKQFHCAQLYYKRYKSVELLQKKEYKNCHYINTTNASNKKGTISSQQTATKIYYGPSSFKLLKQSDIIWL